MRPAPFVARWRMEPTAAGIIEARLRLDDESLFAGHYPGAPILPGSFLIEALFQAARTALGDVDLEEIVVSRFHSPLFPGDEVMARFALKAAGEGRTLVEVIAPSGANVRAAANAAALPPAGSFVREIDAEFILQMLPHRIPALLVDSAWVFDLPGGGSALIARKAITTDEPCFAGAKQTGSYPSLLIVESFCQACGLLRAATGLAGEARDVTKVPVVAKLAGLRFFGDAAPGDLVEHHVELVVRTSDGAVFKGQSVVAGRVVLKAARVVAAMAPVP
jgi:3-hydroxyacyl-[acyl-carrier-protein] dehydratase